MRASVLRPVTAAIAWLYVSACDYTADTVADSCYGEATQAGRAAPAADGGSTRASEPPPSPASGTTELTGQTPRVGPANATVASSSVAPESCDLSGSWLVTVHKVTDGLGNLQTIHDYYFYELEQTGESLRVARSLKCGSDVVGGGAFAITVSYDRAQAGVLKHVRHDGRTGSSTRAADGCQIEFAKQYSVGGATVPHYLDPANPLPTVDQQATAAAPGWEDWDEDGKPGITGVLEGTITGEIYSAAREWASFSGKATDLGAPIKLAMRWDQEPNVLAFEGSPFIGSSAVRAADANLHFVQLARLSADQVTGADLVMCQRLVELAPTLTPEAAGM